ncbi:excisionase [Moellerella wisconsensis]|uniref:Excisionase n=1 Tax=Moellerella wisconsensis TaxID=158849 RepID=A0A9Q8Q408_9GAMM|nr:excisionase [Moellerella wisconsensis]UNH23032.1 excisionase [Moellerella wisconsensis]UNH28340.1 excisionase [Moellerella wisconsensis]UNH31827.1 excisionase [Moellerella wisconsensis]UNH43502.1 excisionase [Moellerella wisconsensis]
MSRMVSLEAWARLEFGEDAPSKQALLKYAKANMMVPPAQKVGKKWMVDRDSRWVGITSKPQLPSNASDKLLRILSNGSKTAHS